MNRKVTVFGAGFVGSGLAPVSPGWFVVNAGDAAWLRNDSFGGRCYFESNGRVLAERPDDEDLLRRYGNLEERFSNLGGYSAESEAARICSNLGLPERALAQPLAIRADERRLLCGSRPPHSRS